MLEAELQARLDEVQATADEICALIASKPHATTLDALMGVYKRLAKNFDCCTQPAANCCFAASMELAQHAALHRDQPADAMPAAGGLH